MWHVSIYSLYVFAWSDQHENDTDNINELVSNQFCSSQHNVNLETYPIPIFTNSIDPILQHLNSSPAMTLPINKPGYWE